jgi:hypothetical protein
MVNLKLRHGMENKTSPVESERLKFQRLEGV